MPLMLLPSMEGGCAGPACGAALATTLRSSAVVRKVVAGTMGGAGLLQGLVSVWSVAEPH